MNMTEVKNILWNLYDEAVLHDAFDSTEDKVSLRNMLEHLKHEHREKVIELRDCALGDGNMAWAAELSHVAAAMADTDLWYGVDVSTV
jgi:hypothetical protein